MKPDNFQHCQNTVNELQLVPRDLHVPGRVPGLRGHNGNVPPVCAENYGVPLGCSQVRVVEAAVPVLRASDIASLFTVPSSRRRPQKQQLSEEETLLPACHSLGTVISGFPSPLCAVY